MTWLNALYAIQKQLDEHIESQHNLKEHNLVKEKMLAFFVELGELANETRCFKFWSLKPPASQEIILEEYVDGIHFLLSLGLDLGYTDVSAIQLEAAEDNSVTEQFLTVFRAMTAFNETQEYDQYLVLFTEFLLLGQLLGFDGEQIQQGYFKKNEVNYKRQQENY
ncbi:hypothetical protein GCM10011391_33310 [Pullulanibacillus camelliae]|uniref:dUTPase n=1 Tax=Pullulanibacillus camelliae TaxID=1707096 RepID=A0A8J2YLD1_9BACL|nr:dUTP diphosphatase [Pullulanibacillus camelliae]GGE51850.1 hypothetical protein GCM10011391_33310 [Pullulanibacillus camelliae]